MLIPTKQPTLANLYATYLGEFTPAIDLSNTYVEQMWQSLYLRYWRTHAITVETSNHQTPTKEEIAEAFSLFLFDLYNVLNRTYDYYTTLLEFYASQKATLLGQIKASTVTKTKINETPQEDNSEGTYEGDAYINHYTEVGNESASDMATPMARLKEVENNYKNNLVAWVDEFRPIFKESGLEYEY